jgi:hypothetical protein
LDHLVLRTERRGAALGFRAHRAETFTPDDPWIVGRGSCDDCGITFVTDAAKNG